MIDTFAEMAKKMGKEVIIKPDKEEFLYLINLKIYNSVKIRQSVQGDQGWLNEVYLYEKFDIGLEYNVRSGVAQVDC